MFCLMISLEVCIFQKLMRCCCCCNVCCAPKILDPDPNFSPTPTTPLI